MKDPKTESIVQALREEAAWLREFAEHSACLDPETAIEQAKSKEAEAEIWERRLEPQWLGHSRKFPE